MIARKSTMPLGAICACIAIPVAGLGLQISKGHSREAGDLQHIFGQVSTMARLVDPELGSTEFEITPLTALRPGQPSRPVWSIQVTDTKGEFVGETIWDKEDRRLISASWVRSRSSAMTAGGMSARQSKKMATIRLMQLDEMELVLPTAGRSNKEWDRWLVWCEAGGARFKVKLHPLSHSLLSAARINGRG
jgi:hypothetical protein